MQTENISEHYNNSLARLLVERIRRLGPMTFRDWMEAALYTPGLGYYASDRIRWGRSGDYMTSPVRSPLFAATFARYFERIYVKLGRPDKLAFVEVGGGNGDFASQFLASLESNFPEVFAATAYVFIERGEASRRLAESRLSPYSGKIEFLDAAPTKFKSGSLAIVFSNELVDAFPVHLVKVVGGELRELFISIDNAENFKWLELAPSNPELNSYLERFGVDLSEGQLAEINLEAAEWLRSVFEGFEPRILITVDYGDLAQDLYDPKRRPSGSLRAIKDHRIVAQILDSPGAQDLTTTVCWSDLIEVGRGFGIQKEKLVRLDQFLIENGIVDELKTISFDPNLSARITLSARDMILPGGMASHFQVLIQAGRADFELPND